MAAVRIDNPRTFRELVLADLYRGQRVVEKVHLDPIDPQFRIASPEGDWWIAMTLPDDIKQRQRRLDLVGDFMAWKLAPSFILVSELHEPDCVYAVGVSHKDKVRLHLGDPAEIIGGIRAGRVVG